MSAGERREAQPQGRCRIPTFLPLDLKYAAFSGDTLWEEKEIGNYAQASHYVNDTGVLMCPIHDPSLIATRMVGDECRIWWTTPLSLLPTMTMPRLGASESSLFS